MKQIFFTKHAQERLGQFRLSEHTARHMIADSDRDNTVWSKSRNAKNAHAGIEVRRFGPFLFTVKGKGEKLIVITVYNEQLDMKYIPKGGE